MVILQRSSSCSALALLLVLVNASVFIIIVSHLNELDSKVDPLRQMVYSRERSSSLHIVNEEGTSKRKKIFFLHISKAGGTSVIGTALNNGETTAGLRRKTSPCYYLNWCPSNITFVQLEHAMGALTTIEMDMLFPQQGESEWMTFVQLREPVSLEESWFREVKHGYKLPEMENATFSDYLKPTFKTGLKRIHSLLLFLGTDEHFGTVKDIVTAEKTAVENLKRFDVITTTEEREESRKIFEKVFGWSDFEHRGPSRGEFDSLSMQQKEHLIKQLQADQRVYQFGRERAHLKLEARKT